MPARCVQAPRLRMLTEFGYDRSNKKRCELDSH